MGPRKRMLGNFAVLLAALTNVLVPSGPMTYTRYRLTHVGWIWLIFPRFVLEKREEVTLGAVAQAAVDSVQAQLQEVGRSSQEEIQQAVALNIATRSEKREAAFKKGITKLIAGTTKVPSNITTKGRSAVQKVHRSLVETVGATSSAHFQEAVRRTLLQMLTYAREEAGVVEDRKDALPPGTRFVYYGDPITLYVIEEPPRVRTVHWDGQYVQVSLPYVVFPIYLNKGKFASMQVFFRNEALSSAEDPLFLPTLPDVMEVVRDDRGDVRPELRFRCWVCFPGPKNSKSSPTAVVQSAQQVFWGSQFLSGHWGRSLREKVGGMKDFSIEKWLKLSLKDPLSVLEVNWLNSNLTVEKLGKDLKRRDDTFDMRTSISKLQKYAEELSVRIGTSLQEVVLKELSAAEDVKGARNAFDEKLKEAIAEANLAEQLGELIRKELLKAHDDSATDILIAEVADKASALVGTIITPAMQTAMTHVADKLNGQTS